jgi:hypothetical protein
MNLLPENGNANKLKMIGWFAGCNNLIGQVMVILQV